ncbi:hypothetical protein NKW84_02970 [Acetobacter senegalensis]|uniref:hypothetical protein n=1 Tax=Acetobacter senegalensis TaxID=446692 RepID=UPI00209D38F1|nr:hypothetical protein [Acetobacter senegalensis]MCP1194823.1 hypothetical protein [Acetobacter senegalensis]
MKTRRRHHSKGIPWVGCLIDPSNHKDKKFYDEGEGCFCVKAEKQGKQMGYKNDVEASPDR